MPPKKKHWILPCGEGAALMFLILMKSASGELVRCFEYEEGYLSEVVRGGVYEMNRVSLFFY